MLKKIFFFWLILILFTNENLPEIRYVSKTGSSIPPYTSWENASDSLQKCINICNEGDTIFVANGVYKESLLINTSITLIGSSMDSTVIDGTGLNARTIDFEFGGSIRNFNIIGAGRNVMSSVALIGKGLFDVKFCRILKSIEGIFISDGPSIVQNCIFTQIGSGYLSLGESRQYYSEFNSLI